MRVCNKCSASQGCRALQPRANFKRCWLGESIWVKLIDFLRRLFSGWQNSFHSAWRGTCATLAGISVRYMLLADLKHKSQLVLTHCWSRAQAGSHLPQPLQRQLPAQHSDCMLCLLVATPVLCTLACIRVCSCCLSCSTQQCQLSNVQPICCNDIDHRRTH